jgi:hypothetical protein
MDVKRDRAKSMRGKSIRELLSGGDRRSIAQSNRVRSMAERNPSLVRELAAPRQ